MSFNFPASPNLNDLYTFNNRTWIYDGVGWSLYQGTLTLTTISANNDLGSNGQVLTSGGSGNVYWSSSSGSAEPTLHPFLLAGM